ncbi:uncharacterized protein BO88DRAFT_477005 [Aspergillus vadensis CBS 113365]|uniref:Uncharacterized protein n=1 Tax=Aspergillus vadensis (strain CBS 113365 / IMI 142717 / IBT 24658) TaxID=1448311 RepID=A0A319C270_ASPVC|nr:hypothetical protein BO88DRAFT_477005 [Aspergillus vadensis CBS 113365]PYH72323.1 hypothetical protein BO88DRAFT_477005 [Aspergillus vadensis CBS 113365]
MPQVLHLTTSSTGSHCIHSLTNSASIQSTDIDYGLNTRLLKYSFTLFSLLSSFDLSNSSSFPSSARPYFVHSICSRASDYLLFPSPLLRRLLLLPVRLRHRRGGSQPSER